MIKFLKVMIIILGLLGWGGTNGCKEKGNEQVVANDVSGRDSQQISKENAYVFEDVLDLWQKGGTDMATSQFIQLNWDGPLIFSAESIFRLTEVQYRSLSFSEQTSIQNDFQQISGTVRGLIKHIISLGISYRQSQDYENAELYLLAVLKCGDRISKPELLEIVKGLGKAASKFALNELKQLYTETNEQVKLEEVLKRLSNI